MQFLSSGRISQHLTGVLLTSVLMIAGLSEALALQAVVMKNIFHAPASGTFRPYVETYWQIDPRSILFLKKDGAWQARIRTDITITKGGDTVHSEHYILATTPVTEGALTRTQNIIDLRRYQLSPGSFQMEIRFTDQIKKNNVFVFTDSFTIAPVGATPLLSDIQLVDTAIRSSKEDVFQRNGRLQIPLATNFIDDRRNTIHYYAELYLPAPDSSVSYISRASISKKEFDGPVNKINRADTLTGSTVQIVEGKLPISSLSSGNYYLNLLIEDSQGQPVTSGSLFLQVLNTDPEKIVEQEDTGSAPAANVPTYLDLNKTFLGKYDPAQLRAILKMLLPISDASERVAINGFQKTPDDTYARYFVYNFWLRRNKLKPEQAWKEYAEQVKKVNKLFGSGMLTGYENDRGIVYLKYGAPTERIVVENENGALPYEVWQYNSVPGATNAVFLFYRPGFVTNDFKLLHTTVNGEIRNKAWRISLYRDGSSADAVNSRAEQYLGNR